MSMLSSILMTYYLPFFYQAKGHSAVRSGIDIIPFVMAAVVGSLISGWLTKVTSRYWPYLILGPVMMAIPGGLFFIVNEHTSNAKLIGYQILYGFGLGLCYQIPREFLQYLGPFLLGWLWLTVYENSNRDTSRVCGYSRANPASIISPNIPSTPWGSGWYLVRKFPLNLSNMEPRTSCIQRSFNFFESTTLVADLITLVWPVRYSGINSARV